MDDIRAIETRYKGYRFRSRLEARWAVYFDAVGLIWEYEPEGFELLNPFKNSPYPNLTRYLPDFWLPQVEMWAEVKPGTFNAFDFYKASLLACTSKRQVLLLDGTPEVQTYDYLKYCGPDSWEMQETPYHLEKPLGDGNYGIDRMDCIVDNQYVNERRFFISCGVTERNLRGAYDLPEVVRAVIAARSARFEYGEKPSYS